MMTDDLSIEPIGYDPHGLPRYADDFLDVRWLTLIEEVSDAGGNSLDFERGVHEIIFHDDIDLIRKAVEIIGLLAEREIERKGCPTLLDEQSGQEQYREALNADLRGDPRYLEAAARVGWPEDPAELDDEQSGWAKLVTFKREIFGDPPWERFERDLG